MRITTGFCALSFFQESFLKRYGLEQYNVSTDRWKPIVYFGAYSPQRDRILNHKGMMLLVWGGSDAMMITADDPFVISLKKKKNIHHIAISNFISEDLKKVELAHKCVPVVCVNLMQFKPAPLGNKVYVYMPDTDQKLYGMEIIKEVMCRLQNVKFVNHSARGSNKVVQNEINKVYAECAIGLRPTKHDGLSSTVIEMGLMGRNVIHNGNTPNSLNFKTVDQICELIELHIAREGKTDLKIAEAVKNYIDIGDNWLKTTNY